MANNHIDIEQFFIKLLDDMNAHISAYILQYNSHHVRAIKYYRLHWVWRHSAMACDRGARAQRKDKFASLAATMLMLNGQGNASHKCAFHRSK